ncbi:MAG: hypothetical protein IJM15_09090 [Erysipelotrichaceae bacterium]|nr:hypothetical protein [Erysipelotrichaceae bacterium]
MKELIKREIEKRYTLKPREMGDLKTIKKSVYHFECESYEIEGIGNLFFIDLKAMLGLMKMETAVITPVYRDLSFCNLDTVSAAGNNTAMFEMYKTSLRDEDLSGFEAIREKYAHLPDYKSEPRWYDEMKLSSCIAKKGRKMAEKQQMMLEECLEQYLKELEKAPQCDPQEKIAANRKYADRLVSEGGVAVDSLTKIIGAEKCSELIKNYMYATK